MEKIEVRQKVTYILSVQIIAELLIGQLSDNLFFFGFLSRLFDFLASNPNLFYPMGPLYSMYVVNELMVVSMLETLRWLLIDLAVAIFMLLI